MAPVTPVYPSLRVDRVDLYQGDRQQQSQFKNGALLKGQITAKQGNQFVLEVDGQKWIARSRTPLRVGQNLNLKVTGTKPAVTLQILADPLTSQVGKSMHLLAGEGELVSKTLELAALLPQENLSPSTRQTLAFYQNSTGLLTGTDQTHPTLTNTVGARISSLLQQILESKSPTEQQPLQTQLQEILNNIPEKAPGADLAKNLLAELQNATGKENITDLLFTTGTVEEARQQLDLLLQQLAAEGPAGQALAETINRVTGNQQELTPTPLLFRLLGLVLDTGSEPERQAPVPPSQGQDLKEYIDRIGTNLERLLAEGKTDQAAATLKSALLEIRQQHDGQGSVSNQAGQLHSTIEAIQLLQVRLAQDSIFLLPLPFPFLEQGFLIVDQDRANQHAEAEQQADLPARYSLYLQLEGLGNLRIDFQQGTAGTRLYFYAEDADRARFLSQNQQELLNMLTATDPESIQFLTGAEDPVKSLLGRITDTGTTVLNTTA